MNDLRLLFHAGKDRKIINLQFKQITNLNLILPLLNKFQSLQSLSLNGNRLTSLPLDLSCLNYLNELDISNNLFRDVHDIIESLRTLPHLTHLLYSFRNQAQQQYLLNELPNLQRVNKVLRMAPVVKQQSAKKSRAMKLTQKDLEDIARTYDEVRQIYKKSRYFVDKQLAEEFDKTVDNVMGQLSNKLQNANTDQQTNASIIGCRYSLVDLCFVKLITYFYFFDKNIATTLQKIHDYTAEALKAINEVLIHSLEKSKAQISQASFKKQQLYRAQIKRLKSVQETHLYQISILEAKNAQLLQKITKNTKENIFELTVGSAFRKQPRMTDDNSFLERTPIKILSLNQIKECMNELYVSKYKHNGICQDTKQPMETLETHMYTFLNQKYGLKPITVEWAMSIVNAIKKYGSENVEVAAFGKILKNQLDQEFAEIIKKWKNIVGNSFKKFKGGEDAFATVLECEEILLNCGFKREHINQLMIKAAGEGGLYLQGLEQLVLQGILKKQGDKIRPLVIAFKAVDEDQDGIINHKELNQLLSKNEKFAQIAPQDIIDAVDPYNLNKITFSHLCDVMLRHPVLKIFFQ